MWIGCISMIVDWVSCVNVGIYIDLSDHPCCKLLQVSPLELALDGVIEMIDGDS